MRKRQSHFIFRNEEGIALITVLVLSLISLSLIAGLIYMLITGTELSGVQKRYKTALEAGFGGADVMYQLIRARGNPNIKYINFGFSSAFSNPDACLDAKLNAATSSTNWGPCDNANYAKTTSLTIDPADVATYDMKFELGIGTKYTVYSKIVETVPGNSGADLGLKKSGVVNSNAGEINPPSVPYLYSFEVLSENADNPNERAKLSILYQY